MVDCLTHNNTHRLYGGILFSTKDRTQDANRSGGITVFLERTKTTNAKVRDVFGVVKTVDDFATCE